MSVRPLAIVFGVCAFGAFVPITSAQMLYWSDQTRSTISRAHVDGSNVEILLDSSDGLMDVRHITVDPVGSKIYWSELNRIRRANADGTNVETILSNEFNPIGVDVDISGRKLYWISPSVRQIFRANLDGSAREVVLNTGLDSNPICIDIDSVIGKMYWTQGSTSQFSGIRRANLDGSAPEEILGGQGWPIDITIDHANARLFFTDRVPGLVTSANLDGSSATTLASGLVFPNGIDVFDGWLYWADSADQAIWRMRSDGTLQERLLTGLPTPRGLAIMVPEPHVILLLAPVTAIVIRRRRRSRGSVGGD